MALGKYWKNLGKPWGKIWGALKIGKNCLIQKIGMGRAFFFMNL